VNQGEKKIAARPYQLMSESTVLEIVLQKTKPQIQELLIAKSGLIIVQIH
jgi:hypothetical protein